MIHDGDIPYHEGQLHPSPGNDANTNEPRKSCQCKELWVVLQEIDVAIKLMVTICVMQCIQGKILTNWAIALS